MSNAWVTCWVGLEDLGCQVACRVAWLGIAAAPGAGAGPHGGRLSPRGRNAERFGNQVGELAEWRRGVLLPDAQRSAQAVPVSSGWSMTDVRSVVIGQS